MLALRVGVFKHGLDNFCVLLLDLSSLVLVKALESEARHAIVREIYVQVFTDLSSFSRTSTFHKLSSLENTRGVVQEFRVEFLHIGEHGLVKILIS